MKKVCALFAGIALFALSASFSVGQNLATLPDDKSVTQGDLPNGTRYYMVTNPTRKGRADISLVWRACNDTIVPELAGIARSSFESTGVFCRRSPEMFLRDNGVEAGANGYIETRDRAVVFRFRDVNLSRGAAAIDSMMLLTFDLIRGYSSVMKERGMRDAGQAVIISGDINTAAMLEKMNMLSMFIPDLEVEEPQDTYRWQPGDSLRCSVITDSSARIATVNVQYLIPRVPREYMGTVLPVVSNQLGNELGMILKKRLGNGFRAEGIPVAGISYSFTGSSQTGSDERYILSVRTSPENISRVIPVISGTLSELASKGTTTGEYGEARIVTDRIARRNAGSFLKDNSVYTDRCISAFLYGASLSSPSDRYGFFASSALADSSGRRFFNRFSSSLIDSTDNLILSYRSPVATLDGEEMSRLFSDSWKQDKDFRSYAVNLDDTTAFDAGKARSKVKRSRTEAVSGGRLWEFANGMKVIYKQTPSAGRMYYTLLVKDGISSVRNLRPGQGAFFADMLNLDDICGLKAGDFRYLLSARDIVMKYNIGVTDVRISGSAPEESFVFLLKALSGVASSRNPDPDAFRYYMESEKLRLEEMAGTRMSRLAALDSIMCSGYRYSLFKSPQGLTPDLQDMAAEFYDRIFSKVNDGVLIIVGNMSESLVREILQEHIGAFSTVSHIVPRPIPGYQPISGESTYTVEGDRKSVDVAMSAAVQLSTSTYMAAMIASMAINDAVLSSTGRDASSVSVSNTFTVVPRERFNIIVSVEERDSSGFSSGIQEMKPVKTLFAVREAVSSLAETEIDGARLDMYKATLKNSIASSQADPSYWVNVLLRRYADGKDFHTDYVSKIDAVTAADVRSIIESLDDSGKVEYLVSPEWSR